MRWVSENGLHYLVFPHLALVDGIRHGVFLRFSQTRAKGPTPFNLGLACGDSDAEVWKNRRQIRALFGFDTMVFARQVHGAEVKTWPFSESPQGPELNSEYACLSGDGLMTRHWGKGLFIQTADCQSVLMADPYKGVVANVHCGWRGSVVNIIGCAVGHMVERFGCRPADLHCGIGPSLGPCCAEFVNYRDEIPKAFWPYMLSANRFNFWQISLDQLVSAGVQPEHVEISNICTRCNTHLFYSYRGEGQTGRFAAVIGLGAG